MSRPMTAGAHMKRSAADVDAKHHRAQTQLEGRESPWPFKVRPVTPKSVDRLWDTVEKLNDPKQVAAAAEDRSTGNAFLTQIGDWLENELETSGCLPKGPDPERVRIHGEALGLVVQGACQQAARAEVAEAARAAVVAVSVAVSGTST